MKRSSRRRTFKRRTGVLVGIATVAVVAVGVVALLRPPSDPEVAAPTSIAPVADSTTLPQVALTVTAREVEVDVDAWASSAPGELRTRPLVASEDYLTDIGAAALAVFDEMDADPPYSATVVQQAGTGKIVLLTHATGSCITDLESKGPWSIHDEPAPCMSTNEPSAWLIGGFGLVVWPDLPQAADSVIAIPDCGPAAMCIGESAWVNEDISIFLTRYEGLTQGAELSLELSAYDSAGSEITSATVVLPPRPLSPRDGLVVSPDGSPLRIELPEGFDMSTFAIERRGLIVESSTQMRYRYRVLDRAVHATDDEQVAVGDVSATSTLVDGADQLIVAIGLERGTVFVELPGGDPADVERTLWRDAFIDMIGDGESTLVLQAGTGFELTVGSGSMSWPGSYVDLIGADGQITVSTGGCFLDYIGPQTDLQGPLQEHERAGTVLLVDESAWWCANGVTVRAEGTAPFVQAMLNGVNIRPEVKAP